jgi:hypothetical protein
MTDAILILAKPSRAAEGVVCKTALPFWPADLNGNLDPAKLRELADAIERRKIRGILDRAEMTNASAELVIRLFPMP